MQMSAGSTSRRAAIQGAGAAAIAAPLLRPSEAEAKATPTKQPLYAPVLEILDHEGCVFGTPPRPSPPY